MTLSAIHNLNENAILFSFVVCDIGGYDFVSYSQLARCCPHQPCVVCDIGGYDFVSYSQHILGRWQR